MLHEINALNLIQAVLPFTFFRLAQEDRVNSSLPTRNIFPIKIKLLFAPKVEKYVYMCANNSFLRSVNSNLGMILRANPNLELGQYSQVNKVWLALGIP